MFMKNTRCIKFAIFISILIKFISAKPSNISGVCLSRGCRETAKIIRQNINEEIDPCDDFYSFACGKFVEKVKIPRKKSSFNRLTGIKEKVFLEIRKVLSEENNPKEPRIFSLAKNFYKGCMNLFAIERHGLHPLRNIIDKLGGWPVLVGDTWDEDKFDWTETDTKLRRMGYNPRNILNVFVFNDLYNTSRNLLYIDPVIPHINTAALRKGYTNTVVNAYSHYMRDVAVFLGADRDRAEVELNQVLDFEMKLVSAIYNTTGYNKIKIKSVKELVEKVPFIPWIIYLNNLTQPIIRIEDTDLIKVKNPNYLLNLKSILETTPKRIIANYMIWRTVADTIPYLNKHARNQETKFKKRNDDKLITRWRECINLITDKKGLAVGVTSLYIRRYFSNNTKAAVKPIAHHIYDEFKNLINESSWMDEMSKEVAIRKVDFMKRVIAYPSQLLNDETIDNYSLPLSISADDHLQNILNLKRFQFDYTLSGLREDTDQRLWITLSDSTMETAYYYCVINAFVLLAGILQPPIFNYDWPNYAKFGSIGFIIGHEMMHGFDSKNSVFDETGSYHPWFSPEVRKKYSDRIDCFIDQYNGFIDESLGFSVNGSLTKNENLADNIGMKVSYYAYKAWEQSHDQELPLPDFKYTPEQIFWIVSVNFLCEKMTMNHRMNLLLMDVHTPDDFRVLGALSNSEEFARSFNCSAGSRMNPVKKCKLW